MDREYLENYRQKERREYEKFLRDLEKGKFSFEKDRYPPDNRFVNLQKPVAMTGAGATEISNIWAQVPFSGSLILILEPCTKSFFERNYFQVSEITKVIDFIKETGRLQVCLTEDPLEYEGLDHLDQFFMELNPPLASSVPPYFFGNDKEIYSAKDTFLTLAQVSYLNFLASTLPQAKLHIRELSLLSQANMNTYVILKLGHYSIVEDIENFMIEDPKTAFFLLYTCQQFITGPIGDIRADLVNYTLENIRLTQLLPLVYRPQEIRFPCEIGKFLLKKLTYAPLGLRACYDLLDHYDAYDLRKVLEALSDAITKNHPDIVNKSVDELSEILDNVWSEAIIPRRITGIKIGVPILMAAIGYAAAGPIGAAGGGLLGDLGFKVADKTVGALFDAETTGLSERLAKLRTKSYQANVYDFKKRYKSRIVPT